MEELKSPFACHLFVCTNCHSGEEKSCSQGNSLAIKKHLKEEVKKRGWKGRVRVSDSGCLGLCEAGPNVLLHPQNIWFSSVGISDTESILGKVKNIVDIS